MARNGFARVVSGQIERSGVKKRITALQRRFGRGKDERRKGDAVLPTALQTSCARAPGPLSAGGTLQPLCIQARCIYLRVLHSRDATGQDRAPRTGALISRVLWHSVSPGKTLTNQEIFDPSRSTLCCTPNFASLNNILINLRSGNNISTRH